MARSKNPDHYMEDHPASQMMAEMMIIDVINDCIVEHQVEIAVAMTAEASRDQAASSCIAARAVGNAQEQETSKSDQVHGLQVHGQTYKADCHLGYGHTPAAICNITKRVIRLRLMSLPLTGETGEWHPGTVRSMASDPTKHFKTTEPGDGCCCCLACCLKHISSRSTGSLCQQEGLASTMLNCSRGVSQRPKRAQIWSSVVRGTTPVEEHVKMNQVSSTSTCAACRETCKAAQTLRLHCMNR